MYIRAKPQAEHRVRAVTSRNRIVLRALLGGLSATYITWGPQPVRGGSFSCLSPSVPLSFCLSFSLSLCLSAPLSL